MQRSQWLVINWNWYKRCYGLGWTRFLGLAKNTTFYGLSAIALNIRKDGMFLAWMVSSNSPRDKGGASASGWR